MHGNKECLRPLKKMDLILKTPLDKYNKKMLRKKSFIKKGLRLGLIFTRIRTFFSSGPYFLRLYWRPQYYFRKKSPKNLKLRTLFPVTFCPRTSENWDFLTNVFIFRNFFSGDFLT